MSVIFILSCLLGAWAAGFALGIKVAWVGKALNAS